MLAGNGEQNETDRMRAGAIAGIIGVVTTSGAVGRGEPTSGEIVIQAGTGIEVGGCFVEVECGCEGSQGRFAALTAHCGEKGDGLGMGLPEGDCLMLGDGLYCIEHVDVGRSVSIAKRYTVDHDDIRAGDVLRAATR